MNTATTARAAVQATTMTFRLLLRHLVDRPSERNSCYASGYLAAMKDHGAVARDDYSVLLSLIEDIEQGHTNRETIRTLTE